MKKVLIVEDIELNADLLTQLLDGAYDVVVASDGAQGVAFAGQHRPDLILMDMSLPVMDGWEATRRLKADDALKHIPIIGLSSHAMPGDADKAGAAGCDDYLTKPIDDELLFAMLNRFLGN